MPPRTSTRKRPGRPKGSTNALKHGFYSHHFHQAEIADLDDLPSRDLNSEIALLRIVIRRTLHLADNLTDPQDAILVLAALGAASTRVANLMRSQVSLDKGHADETIQAIRSAISAATKELNLCQQ